jgi:hypothetical protein
MYRIFITALSCVIFLSACAQPGAASVSSGEAIARAATNNQHDQPTGLQPLEREACIDLRDAFIEELGVEVATKEVDFEDGVTGARGSACRLIAKGTGSDFGPFVDAAARLADVLHARGWRDEMQFAADGPTGTRLGFSQDNALGVLDVGWQPAPGVVCNKPIVECNILPGQQRFTITLDLVQR